MQLFITGTYRSGSTLLTRILNNHPGLWITYDSVHFMRFCYQKYNPIATRENYRSLLQEVRDRISERWGMTFELAAVLNRLDTLEPVSYADVYDQLMQSLAGQYNGDAKGWGEKTVLAWSKIPDFLTMFPEGKVVHILRDPRDVLCSFKRLTTAPEPGYLNTAFVALDAFLACRYYSNTLSPKNFRVVRYEELVSQPAKQVASLCAFLDLPYVDAMLDVMRFTNKTDRGWWNGDSAFEDQITAIRTTPIGRWKEKATPLEVFWVEMVNRTAMPIFGYELSGVDVSDQEWLDLFELLHRDCLLDKYRWWLQTGRGVEGFSTSRAEECHSTPFDSQESLHDTR